MASAPAAPRVPVHYMRPQIVHVAPHAAYVAHVAHAPMVSVPHVLPGRPSRALSATMLGSCPGLSMFQRLHARGSHTEANVLTWKCDHALAARALESSLVQCIFQGWLQVVSHSSTRTGIAAQSS